MIDIIASQIPLAHEYFQGATAQWNFSRHPENLRDTIDAIKSEGVTRNQKIGAVACLVPIAWALGPGNEMTLGFTVGNAVEGTDSIGAGVAAASATTGPLELSAGFAMAYIVNRFTKATDVIRKRYVDTDGDSPASVSEKQPSSLKKLARVFGIVALTGTGASGATLDQAIHDQDQEGRNVRNKKTAALAAGLLAAINAGYTAVILGAAKGAEAAGAESSVDVVADFVSNPLFVGGLLGGAVIAKQQYDIAKYNKKYDDAAAETAHIEGAANVPSVLELKQEVSESISSGVAR